MKAFFYCLKVDLQKSIFSYGFILCIIVTFLLCFTSVIYTNTEGQEFSAFEVLADRDNFKFVEFNSGEIIYNSISAYLTMFLPILSALPFVSFFCAERVSGYLRFNIIRCGKFSYYTSKFFTAIISGGLAIMLSYSAYAVVICIIFPNNISFANMVKFLAGLSLYGMISVIPAFLLSSFIKNKYLICCFPFIFMHFYFTTLTRIQSVLIDKNNWEAIVKMDFLYPDRIVRLFFGESFSCLIYNLVLAFVAYFGFIIIMNKRFDYGT